MRRTIIFVATLLLAALGVAINVRMNGTVPNAGALIPLGGGLLLASVLAFVRSRYSERAFISRPVIPLLCATALLALLVVFGRRYRGGLYLPGLINPSEFVKLFTVVWAAGVLSSEKGAFMRLAGGFALIAGLTAICRDFGLILQLALTIACMTFAASWTKGLAAFALIAAMAAVVVALPPESMPAHFATRLAIWRDPLADPTGGGWQTLQGLSAIVSGGWSGAGFGLGDVHAIPIASSDFVYAALAEDLGFVGCAVLLAAYLALFAAAGGADALQIGLVASIAVQVFLNAAGVLNLLPMTGITLPLVSHGGSSLMAVLAMCGILFGGAKAKKPKN